METNSIKAWEQARIIWHFIRRKPVRAGLLLVLMAAVIMGKEPHRLVVIKFGAWLGTVATQRIETLLVLNPNSEKQEVIAHLSPTGEPDDLGFNYAYAVDFSSKERTFVKFKVIDNGAAVLNIIGMKLGSEPIKILGVSEVNYGGAVMGWMALAYLLSWLGALKTLADMGLAALAVLVFAGPLRAIAGAVR